MPLFRFTIEHRHRLSVAGLNRVVGLLAARIERHIMSVFRDRIDRLEIELDGAIARVREDVASLDDEIVRLRGVIEANVASAEDLARLDTLLARVAAIDPIRPDVLPPDFEPLPPVAPPSADPPDAPTDPGLGGIIIKDAAIETVSDAVGEIDTEVS